MEFLMSGGIGKGKEVILVYGNDLSNCGDSEFYKYLRENYKNVSNKGIFSSCPWVYINLKNKTFFPGIPGIRITEAFHGHAVTVDEFFTIEKIYEELKGKFCRNRKVKDIYSKYKGKDVFVFNKERFDCDEGAEVARQLIKERELHEQLEKERVFCFIELDKQKILQREFILLKSEETRCLLPSSGIYDGMLQQQSIPGDEYYKCKVEFTDTEIIIRTDGYTNGPDYLENLKIYRHD